MGTPRIIVNKAISVIEDHGRFGSVTTFKRKGDFWKSEWFAKATELSIRCSQNQKDVVKRLSEAGFQTIDIDNSWGFEWDSQIIAKNRKFN